MKTWNERKLDFIRNLYSAYYYEWRYFKYTDDRAIFCTIYDMLIDAIASLDDEPVILVKNGMNRVIRENTDIMDRIIANFEEEN